MFVHNSDNIFGVPGVGQVSACKLIREYGSYEEVLVGVEKKTKRGKREEDILNYKERIKLAYSLKKMDIVPYVPRLRYHNTYEERKVEEFFLSLGFASLLKDIKYLI